MSVIEDLKQRCTLAEQCLPVSAYRVMLAKLHNDMLGEIDKLQNELIKYSQRELDLSAQLTAAQGEVEKQKQMVLNAQATAMKLLDVDLVNAIERAEQSESQHSLCQSELQTYRDGVRVEGVVTHQGDRQYILIATLDILPWFPSGQHIQVLVLPKEGE